MIALLVILFIKLSRLYNLYCNILYISNAMSFNEKTHLNFKKPECIIRVNLIPS